MKPTGPPCWTRVWWIVTEPNKKRAQMMQMMAQALRTKSRSSMPHCQTRSVLLKNLNAAASSSRPRMILSCCIQSPDLDLNLDIRWGNRPSRKNGNAKTVANTSIPKSGQNHCPSAAAIISVPTNWTVQVKEVRVNAKPIAITPSGPPIFRDRWSARSPSEPGN